MKYLTLTTEEALEIISKGWYLPTKSQNNIIDLVKNQPSQYIFHIVQKYGKDNNSWIMMHIEEKAA